MSPTIRHKYKYFHSTVQRAKDRRQKFQFFRLPFDVRPCNNVKLNLPIKENNRQTSSIADKHSSPDSEDDFRSCCRNFSHQQQVLFKTTLTRHTIRTTE